MVDGVALAWDENGNVKLDVALADVQLADADICTVVVAFASTSVFVIVLVQVSVVVALLASTEAGVRQATSAAAAVVRRIVEGRGRVLSSRCSWDCAGIYAGEASRERLKRARSRKVNRAQVVSFLSSLAGSRPGGCFRRVLFEVERVVQEGGGSRLRQMCVVLRERDERALLVLEGM